MEFSSFFDFKQKNKASLILGVAALIAGIAALIIFQASKSAEFTKQRIETYRQDIYVTAALIAGIVLCGAGLVFDLKIVKYFGFIAYLFAFLNYIVFEVDYLGSIFSSIDPTEITADFVAMLVLLAAATVLALISGITAAETAAAAKKEA